MPKLTDRFLATLEIEEGRKDRLVFDTACPGLGVRLTARGTRTFLAQWTDPATRRKVREPIGVWGGITIDQAREAVRARLGAVAKGIDPKSERVRRRAEADRERAEAALTFDALVSEWAALHLAQRRERYRSEAVRAIKHAFADLLRRPAARVTKADAVTALDRLVRDGKAAMAGRTLAYARAAFQWAVKRGKVPGNPFQGFSVTTGTAARERVLSDAELADVWSAACEMGYPWGPFFRLALLTLQRREEVAGMRWSEISDDLSLWTVPGSRMKNGKPHDIHLSAAARSILREAPRIRRMRFGFHHHRKDTGFWLLESEDGARRGGYAGARQGHSGRSQQAGNLGRMAHTRSPPFGGLDPGEAGIRFDRRRQDPCARAGEAARCCSRLSAPRFRARARGGARRVGRPRPRGRGEQRRTSSSRLIVEPPDDDSTGLG